jgi:periplasmic divalent cation tolerance protein
MDYAMIVVTCPSPDVAESIARRLVDERLAACGNVTAPVTSVYRWKGIVRRESEVVLFLKTRRSLVGDCVRTIRGVHPYELPEILAIPVVAGLREYLAWVRAETRPPRGTGRRQGLKPR